MKKFFHFLPNLLIPVFLIIGTFLVYKYIYPDPRIWYDHYLYLAKSILHGSISVDNIPEYYQDVNVFNSHKYLPFPPLPAITLIPFILLNSKITEQLVSIIIASINIGLIYILLKKYTKKINALILSLFIAFGTVYFWASIVGTSWYFAHIVAFLYLILAILFSSKNNLLSSFFTGILFAFSALSRITIIFGGLYFVINYWHNKKNLISFLIGCSVFVPIILFYNYSRFGNIFDTGYTKIYENYTKGGYSYSIQRVWQANSKDFNYLDLRSIPYHLYTLFIMPPEITDLNIFKSKPSPYGMGILYISPLLLLIFGKFSKNKIETQVWFGAIPIAFITFLHYAQGWVQFGYRFLVDFLPFLVLIMALKFKLTKFNILLLIISLVVSYWGTSWAIKLGW